MAEKGFPRPTVRNAVMVGVAPIVASVLGTLIFGVFYANQTLQVHRTASPELQMVGQLVQVAFYVLACVPLVVGMSMIGELKAITRTASLAWWPLFVPLYNIYYTLRIVPAEVLAAKKVAGIATFHRPLMLYLFFWAYALASDLNDIARAPRKLSADDANDAVDTSGHPFRGVPAQDARASTEEADEAERRFGRLLSAGLPIGTVLSAIVVLVLFSAGPALLVMVGGMLLGTIALLWTSLRTLSGDAPLPQDLEALAARSTNVTNDAEEKRRVLRALKDLEHEHDIGKIDDADYAEVAARYRNEAKQLMRDMDVEIEPLRERAEELARAHLLKRKIGARVEPIEPVLAKMTSDPPDEVGNEDATRQVNTRRLDCSACATSNEPDAMFCKKCRASLVAAPEKKVDATA